MIKKRRYSIGRIFPEATPTVDIVTKNKLMNEIDQQDVFQAYRLTRNAGSRM